MKRGQCSNVVHGREQTSRKVGTFAKIKNQSTELFRNVLLIAVVNDYTVLLKIY